MKPLLAFIILAVLSVPAGAQDFELGLAAYDRGDFETAITEWRPIAEQGDARAQFNLGVIHFNGQGVPHDPTVAAKWYRAAADQGYGLAQANLAFLYETGQGVLQNFVEAYKWSALAARNGVARDPRRGDLAATMTAEQVATAEQAVALWQPEARELPAGASLDSSDPLAQVRRIQRRLAALGYAVGAPDGVVGRRTQAALRDYQDKNGLPVSGAADGETTALLFAPGGELPMAARPEDAQPALPSEQGIGSHPVLAEDCDRLTAHPADPLLPSGMKGVAFEDIETDHGILACRLALALNAGDIRYQFQLARSLHKADRLPEAVVFYLQAATQGHPLAQKTLGFVYANGLGVAQDYAKAARWHHAAADQRDGDALHNLGYLYAGGYGVDPDDIQAHMWYNLAAAQGSAGAAAKRDTLAARMDDAQIAEAERRALAWIELHPEVASFP